MLIYNYWIGNVSCLPSACRTLENGHDLRPDDANVPATKWLSVPDPPCSASREESVKPPVNNPVLCLSVS